MVQGIKAMVSISESVCCKSFWKYVHCLEWMPGKLSACMSPLTVSILGESK